ncbi:MAG TPA: hypothetical protein VGL73_14770 [Caulobacteraceae bacterium]
MHISNNSIASLFQQLQAAAGGSSISASFGAHLTGQNLPTIGAGASVTSSQAPSPLSSTPSSQFASNILSELLAAQQSPQSQQQADPLQATGRHHRHHRMEAEATTDETATASPTSSGSVAGEEVTSETIAPAASAAV